MMRYEQYYLKKVSISAHLFLLKENNPTVISNEERNLQLKTITSDSPAGDDTAAKGCAGAWLPLPPEIPLQPLDDILHRSGFHENVLLKKRHLQQSMFMFKAGE